MRRRGWRQLRRRVCRCAVSRRAHIERDTRPTRSPVLLLGVALPPLSSEDAPRLSHRRFSCDEGSGLPATSASNTPAAARCCSSSARSSSDYTAMSRTRPGHVRDMSAARSSSDYTAVVYTSLDLSPAAQSGAAGPAPELLRRASASASPPVAASAAAPPDAPCPTPLTECGHE